jgi:glycosyltransferase involved in cell wall biosynthesis
MIILHFFPFFNIHARGGTEVFVKDIANHQVKAGNEVHIFCPNVEEATKVEHLGEIKITYFPFPYGTTQQEFLSGKGGHKTNQQFVELVNGVKPGIIHMHGYHACYHKYISSLPGSYPILFTPHLINTICLSGTLVCNENICDGKVDYNKCSVCLNNISYPGKSVSWLKRKAFIESAMVKNARLSYKFPLFSITKSVLAQLEMITFFKKRFYFDALSRQYHQVLKVNGVPQENISVFDNPVFDVANYAVEGKDKTTFIRLLYVGRVSNEKGIAVLLNALEGLVEYKDKFSLTLIGKTDDEVLLEKLNQLKLSGLQLNIEGEKSHEMVVNAYKTHDYLVFPTSRLGGEMLPMVLQEAVVNNLPVISSDIAAAKEIIFQNINGLFFKADDSLGLAKTLRKVITGEVSVKFRYTQKTDINELKGSYYEDLYQRVIKANSISKMEFSKT